MCKMGYIIKKYYRYDMELILNQKCGKILLYQLRLNDSI